MTRTAILSITVLLAGCDILEFEDTDTDTDSACADADKVTWYADNDGDGYGSSFGSKEACEAPAGYVAEGDDCDDQDAAVSPGAAEVCDDIDNNCDASIDEGVTSTFYADADGDGYGDLDSPAQACAVGDGLVADSSDCDDDNDGVGELCAPEIRLGNTSPDQAVTLTVTDSTGAQVLSRTIAPLSEMPHTALDEGAYTMVMTMGGTEIFRAESFGLHNGTNATLATMDNKWGYIKNELESVEADQFRLNMINYGSHPVSSGWIGPWNGSGYEVRYTFGELAQDVETIQVIDVPEDALQLEVVWHLNGSDSTRLLADFDIQDVARLNAGTNAFSYVKAEGACSIDDYRAGAFDCDIRLVTYNIDGSITELEADWGWPAN